MTVPKATAAGAEGTSKITAGATLGGYKVDWNVAEQLGLKSFRNYVLGQVLGSYSKEFMKQMRAEIAVDLAERDVLQNPTLDRSDTIEKYISLLKDTSASDLLEGKYGDKIIYKFEFVNSLSTREQKYCSDGIPEFEIRAFNDILRDAYDDFISTCIAKSPIEEKQFDLNVLDREFREYLGKNKEFGSIIKKLESSKNKDHVKFAKKLRTSFFPEKDNRMNELFDSLFVRKFENQLSDNEKNFFTMEIEFKSGFIEPSLKNIIFQAYRSFADQDNQLSEHINTGKGDSKILGGQHEKAFMTYLNNDTAFRDRMTLYTTNRRQFPGMVEFLGRLREHVHTEEKKPVIFPGKGKEEEEDDFTIMQ